MLSLPETPLGAPPGTPPGTPPVPAVAPRTVQIQIVDYKVSFGFVPDDVTDIAAFIQAAATCGGESALCTTDTLRIQETKDALSVFDCFPHPLALFVNDVFSDASHQGYRLVDFYLSIQHADVLFFLGAFGPVKLAGKKRFQNEWQSLAHTSN